MVKTYAKGRRYEYKIKKLFEKHGYFVIRCASSKPVDLVAFRNLDVFFIECKTFIPNIHNEVIDLYQIVHRTGGAGLLIYHLKDSHDDRVVLVNEEYKTGLHGLLSKWWLDET